MTAGQWKEIGTVTRGQFAGARIFMRPTPPAPPANARILVSRNKREGRFAGRRPRFEIDPLDFRVTLLGYCHQREGHGDEPWLPLRARRKP